MTASPASAPRSFPIAAAGIDRAAAERTEEDLVERLRADDRTRVIVVHGDRAPLAGADRLAWVGPHVAPEGAEWAFLGRRDDGTPVLVAAYAADGPEPVEATGWGALRAVGGLLAPVEAGTFTAALSLGRWLRDAAFCPACGTRTELRMAGWARHCPACGREHFPRTDPAVIVAVSGSRRPSRLLLGANALWGGERYSCFAGFAEAGESLESTVLREVHEEAGVALTDLRYRGSQAWPYPRSLMLGFAATAVDDDAARPDGEEIVDVRWFDREEIGAALADESDVVLPGAASIARRLIEDWYVSSAAVG
ncbi:NAD(+) diphosphatase [Microbacterium sp. CJ88]|uniref:NAD(+) diphosphatase n=1 Tax=Microbacterium sp. CJ88 TaxID=3445672 RepID=UPI003F65CF56